MPIVEHTVQQFRQQPRAMQWSIVAALGFVLFLIWDQGIAPITADWKSQADAIQLKLERVRTGALLTNRFSSLEDEISGIGSINLPGPDSQGRQDLQITINEIFIKHAVSEESVNFNNSRVKRGTLASVVGTRRLEALKADLEFVAKPDVAMAVIGELEASPDIEFIKTINLTTEPGQKIKVRLTCESWVLGERS